jgi:uncharacterized protein YndB with AHSA1/START domain
MASYGFLTTWVLDAPVDPVWEAIYDTAAWPSWWPAVRAVDELEQGASDDTGKLFRIVWRGRLPYDVAFDVRVGRVQRPHLMEGLARRPGGNRPLAGLRDARRTDCRDLRMGRPDHPALDERARPTGTTGLLLEP